MGRSALRVGLWPGSFENGFVGIFAQALREAGAVVIDVQDPTLVDPRSIDIFHIHWPEQLFWAGGGRLDVVLRLKAYSSAMRRLPSCSVVHRIAAHHHRPWFRSSAPS